VPDLIHLVYSSAATHPFSRGELTELLTKARRNNEQQGLTGMLLHTEGSFFQVLEGPPEAVDALFDAIKRDKRHTKVTLIIREPIARRSFGDWTMGHAEITPEEADAIVGLNDFFHEGRSYDQLEEGRAKKLLAAFMQGRWRTRLTNTGLATGESSQLLPDQPRRGFSYAFQPIINARKREVFSYEALIRGEHNEPAGQLFEQISQSEIYTFDEESRIVAIELAARMGLSTHLNLNFLPLSLESSPTAITSILATAKRYRIEPKQLVLEILEKELISDFERFSAAVNEHRGTGLTFAIDDFGAGHAGLNLLADFQPEFLKLDMHLVRDIDSNGPRQAIVRGILRTCLDLGIDVIAEGVETIDEYEWLSSEGIELFQGWLFAQPGFEQLPQSFQMP
jgi:EAL domain-containing protein (putative c-di-GMP-specific phosphodiesterase class I)